MDGTASPQYSTETRTLQQINRNITQWNPRLLDSSTPRNYQYGYSTFATILLGSAIIIAALKISGVHYVVIIGMTARYYNQQVVDCRANRLTIENPPKLRRTSPSALRVALGASARVLSDFLTSALWKYYSIRLAWVHNDPGDIPHPVSGDKSSLSGIVGHL